MISPMGYLVACGLKTLALLIELHKLWMSVLAVTCFCACLTISLRLQVGTVWVNCWLVRDLNVPFGGSKMSGVGREGLKDSLEFYTEVKTICIKH